METPNMTSKGSSGSPLPAKAPRTRKSTIAGSRWQKAAAPSLTCSCDCDCSGPPLDSLYSLWFWLAPLSFTLYASCWCWPDRLPPGSQLGISVQPRGRKPNESAGPAVPGPEDKWPFPLTTVSTAFPLENPRLSHQMISQPATWARVKTKTLA